MAPVGSSGFLSRECEGEVGADIQRLKWGLVAQALASGGFSLNGYSLIAAVALGTRTINGIVLRCLRNKTYITILSLLRSFVVKT